MNTNATVAGFTLSSSNAAFSAAGQAFTVNGDATFSAGTVLWASSTWTDSGTLANSATVIAEGSDTLNGTFVNAVGATLRVTGTPNYASAALTVANGFTNSGTVELTNTAATYAYSATLTVSTGTLINTGAITILPGANGGGQRTLAAQQGRKDTEPSLLPVFHMQVRKGQRPRFLPC